MGKGINHGCWFLALKKFNPDSNENNEAFERCRVNHTFLLYKSSQSYGDLENELKKNKIRNIIMYETNCPAYEGGVRLTIQSIMNKDLGKL